jgi:rhodanese-related sulfurtransferase
MSENIHKVNQLKLMAKISNIMGILSAPVRLKLLHFLSQAPLTVEVLSEKIEESTANTSMHLRKMLGLQILEVEVIGQKRLYSLHPSLFNFWEQIQDFVLAVHPSLQQNTEYEEEPLDLLRQNKIVLLDIRPEDEHSGTDHDNRILIPFTQLKKKLHRLPKRKKIFVLCRGRLCTQSSLAVELLRADGFNAYRLNESWYSLKKKLQKR